MDQSEISMLILRHLAREGCKDTIRAYMNECPPVKSVAGGQTDVELFRQKLLNRSLSLSLTELLSEFARAKSMIQDLTSKLLYEWNALSSVFLSPHDSMATQLAHIAQLLETKCKRVTMEAKCVGTSDDPIVVPSEVPSSSTSEPPKVMVDVEVQVSIEEAEEAEAEDELPVIVESLMAPQNLDKMVEIANKELNRSTQSSHENVLTNDTEAEIDKMLLDILHGIGPGSAIPNNALSEGINSQSVNAVEVAGSQLMEMFQDAHSVIVNTPIPGTLTNPEDSASKQPKHFTSFLDLIDTPFKNAFVSNPSTPVAKPSTSISNTSVGEVEKFHPGLKTKALDFGMPSASVSQTEPSTSQVVLTKAKSSGPRYTILQQSKQVPVSDLDRLRRRRDITPRIPSGAITQNSGSGNSEALRNDPPPSNTAALLRSASKRKFTTPVKLSPAKALMSSVNFYCPSSSLQERLHSTPTSRHSDSIDTPIKLVTPTPAEKSATVNDFGTVKSPLVTINYNDIACDTAVVDKTVGAAVVEPQPSDPVQPAPTPATSTQPPDIPAVSSQVLPETSLSATNMTTPDTRPEKEQQDESYQESSRTPHMYNRLLASVRHSRPITVVNKKSYSTPRKKGHIRNLMFKTPPGVQTGKGGKLTNVEEEVSLKRKLSPTPPLGSRSKKRLKWTTLVTGGNDSAKQGEKKHEEIPPPPMPIQIAPTVTTVKVSIPPQPSVPVISESLQPEQPPKSRVSMTEVASKVVSKVSTRGRGSKKEQPKIPKKVATDPEPSPAVKEKKTEEQGQKADPSPPTTTAAGRRRRSRRMEEQKAAEAAAVTAVPLGTRPNSNNARITRHTRSATKSSPEAPRNRRWMNPMNTPIVEPVRPPPAAVVDQSVFQTPSTGGTYFAPTSVVNSSGTPPAVWPNSDHSTGLNVSHAESQPNSTPGVQTPKQTMNNEEGGTPRTRQSGAKPNVSGPGFTPTLEINAPTTVTPSPRQNIPSSGSTRLSSLKLAKAFPNLSSSLEGSREQSSTDKGKSSTASSTSTPSTSGSSSTLGSPTRTRPKSPRKSPQKGQPRRILPKPVPPDHPLPPVFPPPLPNTGYVLSIPSSNTPTRDSDIFSSVNVVSNSPKPPPAAVTAELLPVAKKFPQLSSSDSSGEIRSPSPVPMTPRLRPDPGEESSMHTRLFPDNSSSGLGGPMFSSTPLKFDLPETPGKNIKNTVNSPATNLINISGEGSRGSLFDTPLKVILPPAVSQPPAMATPVKSSQKPSTRSTPLKVQQTRKSPRKVKTPVKQQKVSSRKPIAPVKLQTKASPRKATTPVKSTYKSRGKCQQSRSSKQTPSKSPTPKKKPVQKEVRKDQTEAQKDQKEVRTDQKEQVRTRTSETAKTSHEKPKKPKPNENSSAVNTPAASSNTSGSFLDLCTKSKSFMRLAEIARRGRLSAPPSAAAPPPPPPSEPPLAKPPQQQPAAYIDKPVEKLVTKENNGKTTKKPPEPVFQFAVSGRAKQLSLSEHETLIGLLKIGSEPIKTQPVQVSEPDILSGIDVFQFLRKVHQTS